MYTVQCGLASCSQQAGTQPQISAPDQATRCVITLCASDLESTWGILHELCQVPTVIVMMQEKNGVIEQLEKEKQKKGEQVQQAHTDLARQAALIKDLQAHPRGKKEFKPLGVPAEQV